jgi:hypothetical protein
VGVIGFIDAHGGVDDGDQDIQEGEKKMIFSDFRLWIVDCSNFTINYQQSTIFQI